MTSKFWEISDDILEIRQDRDMVAIEVYTRIICDLSNGTIVNAL